MDEELDCEQVLALSEARIRRWAVLLVPLLRHRALDVDDLLQEGREQALAAWSRWECRRALLWAGADTSESLRRLGWFRWLDRRLQWRGAMLLREARHCVAPVDESYPQFREEPAYESLDVASWLRDCCDSRDLAIIERLLIGKSQRQIARDLRMSQPAIAKRVRRIRQVYLESLDEA